MHDLIKFEFAILLMGATMCLFMALYFYLDSRNPCNAAKSANKFLSGFMLIYGLTFVDNFLEASDSIFQHPHMTGLLMPAFFLLGPFFYFYIRESYDIQAYIQDKKRYRHFILPILSVILMLPFYFFPENLKFSLLMEDNDLPETVYLLIGVLGVMLVQIILPIQILYYLIKSYRLLMQYFTNLKEFFANIEDQKQDWLRFLILMMSLLWLLYAYEDLIGWPEPWSDGIEFTTTLIDVAVVYFLSFKGLRQASPRRQDTTEYSEDTPELEPKDDVDKSKTPDQQKYAKSALSEKDAHRIRKKLFIALETDELYNDSMLSLRSLSDHTKISTNYISQVINQELNCNFFDFVNGFRIEAAKKHLCQTPENKTPVLEIAHTVGFNSKSTFNTAFKRHTGLTPTEYRKQQTALAS